MLPKTMKALVSHSKGEYKLETAWPVPECGPEDVIIKVEGCGVCASDLKCMHGAAMFWGDGTQKPCVTTPFIPGHEFLGVIAEVGNLVKDWAIGDRVTAEQIVPCWECRYCKSGKYWMCQPHVIFGFFNDFSGGMAEYMRLPKGAIIHRIPKDMPFEAAILVEPYSCSKHCVDRADVKPDDIVVLSGAGTLGLGMVAYAKIRHPKKLIVLDMKDSRLEKAKELGADLVWNP